MSQGQSGRGGMRGGRRGGPGRGGPGPGGGQGRSRRGTTTTPQAVARQRANIANRRGTLYSPSLRDAVTRANEAARARSLDARKTRAAQEAIQAQEAKQVSPTPASVQSMVSRMDNERRGLMGLAADNQITNKQLGRLAALNEAIGLNRTTGMGPIESVRSTISDPAFRADLSRAAKTYSKISPLGILASSFLGKTGESLRSLIASQRANNLSRLGNFAQALTGRRTGRAEPMPPFLSVPPRAIRQPTPLPKALPRTPSGGFFSKIRNRIVPPSTGEMMEGFDPTERISDFAPGYGASLLNPGIRTADFRDSDGDGVDDRDQVGPGMPKGIIPDEMQAAFNEFKDRNNIRNVSPEDLARIVSRLSTLI